MNRNNRMYENVVEMPKIGDVIRTKKMSMEGKVEKIGKNRAGYDEIIFRIEDGRLMKTPLENIIVIQKLADEDIQELNEISTELLAKYKTAAGKDAREADKRGDVKRGDKRFRGVVRATNKQFANDAKNRKTVEGTMGGINRCAPSNDVSYQHVLDKNKETKYSRVIGETFEEKLQYFLEANFNDILNKQYTPPPKKSIVDIDFHGWTIRYRPKSQPTDNVQWMVLDRKNDIKHKGESTTDKDAVRDAEEWIKSGGIKKDATAVVDIDFNIGWTKEFSPEGDSYYVTFIEGDNGPVMLQSTEPKPGFKKTHIRAGSLQSAVLSPKESNAAGLQPNGRYLLGGKEDWDENTVMFPLIFQGVVEDPRERFRMPGPGITVAHSRM